MGANLRCAALLFGICLVQGGSAFAQEQPPIPAQSPTQPSAQPPAQPTETGPEAGASEAGTPDQALEPAGPADPQTADPASPPDADSEEAELTHGATASSMWEAAHGEVEGLDLDGLDDDEGPSRPWWLAGELGASFLSNLVEQSTLNLTFHYGAKFGHRFDPVWGVFFQIEHNLWVETEIEQQVRQGALNIGVGLELRYFRERMRASLAMGPSILLQETALDSPGTTGLFVDIRPAGLRWPVSDKVALMWDPLTFTLVMPSLSSIPLVQIQYRTVFTFEYDLGL